MKRRNWTSYFTLIFLLGILSSCSSYQKGHRGVAEIPTELTRSSCSSLMNKIVDPLWKNPKRIAVEKLGQKTFSSEDFVRLLEKGLSAKLRQNTLSKILLQTPFAKEMGVSQQNINELLNIINSEQLRSFDQIKSTLESYFSIYNRGIKKITKIRDYDESLESFDIENQCSFNSCWTFASISKMEHTLSQKLGQRIGLSEDHFYAQYILNEVRAYYRSTSLPNELFVEEGDSSKFENLVPHFGIMPESFFNPKKAFSSKDKEIFLKEIKERLFNHTLDIKITKNPDLQNQLIKDVDKDIKRIIKHYIDDLDKKFEYRGNTYSAKTFFQKFLGGDDRKIKRFLRTSTAGDIFEFGVNKNIVRHNASESFESGVAFQNASISDKEIESLIIRSIKNKEPLFFAYEIPNENLIGSEALIQLINPHTGKAFVDKNLMTLIQKLETQGGHAVIITGYELDLQGRIKTFKIQNSYGEKYGDNGILHMDRSFFWQYYGWVTTN